MIAAGEKHIEESIRHNKRMTLHEGFFPETMTDNDIQAEQQALNENITVPISLARLIMTV